MRGRGRQGDPEFGSDSFLDIVANLVGILVILIVLAGLRAAQAPVESDEPQVAAASSTTPESADPSVASRVTVSEAAAGASETSKTASIQPEPESAIPTEPEAAPNPKAELGPAAVPADAAEQRLRNLQRTVTELTARLNTVPVANERTRLEAIQTELTDVSGELRGLRQRLVNESEKKEQALLAASGADSEYQQLRRQLVDVNRLLEEVGTAERPVQELELRINPVGRRGRGKAVVFRIDRGQVFLLPAHELFELAEERELGGTRLTMRTGMQRGVVGPIDGVTLDYELRIEMTRVANGRGGRSLVARPRLQGYLKTSAASRGEDVETALKENGLVTRTMLSTPRERIVRLFVGTDSFAAGRRVAAFIRDYGHAVSSVPVEPGSDIPVVVGNRSDAIVQ